MKILLIYSTLLLFTTLSVVQNAIAQIYPVQVTTQMIPPYSLKLSDYTTTSSEKLFVNLLLTDALETNRQIRLKMYIEGQGLNIQTADFITGSNPIYLDGGLNKRLSNLDLGAYFNLNNLLGITPAQYNQLLPDGRYNFCFEVYDFFSQQRLSSKSCVSINLILNDPPILNLPYRGDLITERNPQNIVFTWTPRHLNATGVQYEFTLKELWDKGIDPQAAFLASPSLHQETTFAPTLMYGPANTQLLAGKTYGWQVRALVSDGISETSVFRNNGYSEIYHFKYEDNCDAPSFILSEAQNSQTVQITWNYSEHLRYKIQYRKKGYGDDDWFSLYAYNQQYDIYNLEAGTTYEFRVGGECVAQGGFAFSNNNEFTTPSEDEESYYNCGVLPEIEISNQDPLLNIGVNEVFTAGDFPVTVKEVKTLGNGVYSGWGFITVPYLADTKIRIEFKNIHINTQYQLTKGIVETSYDPNWKGIGSIDDAIDDVFGASGEISTFDASNVDIGSVQVDENGNVTLIDEEGNEIPIEVDTPVIITDANGEKWEVNEEGNVTALGPQAEGGKPTKSNTSGMASNRDVTQISSTDVSVIFTPSGYYATDQLRKNIKDRSFTAKYESIPQAKGGDYNVLYKALSDSPQPTDKLIATAKVSKGKTTNDIIFKTKEGVKIPVTWSGNKATLELKKRFNFAKDEIIATVKPTDSTGNYDIAGKANIWHLKQKTVNITIVPVGKGAVTSTIEDELNTIYNPVGVQFHVEVDSTFEIATTDWDTNGNEVLDIGESSVLANYTPEERAILNYYKNQRPPQSEMYYVFVLGKDIVTSDSKAEGFMPLKRQYGFIFNSESTARTIAHELGHGVFGLKHPFTEYKIKQGSTDLLMDYDAGTTFTHMDWQKIHAPGLQLYFFQDDEEGELLGAKLLTTYELQKLCYQYKLVKDAQYHLVNTGILPYEEVFLFASKDDLDTYKELRKKSSYDAKSKILKTYTYWGVNAKEKLENMFKKADEKCVCPISFNDSFMDSDEKFQELVNSIKLHLQCNNENYQLLSSEDVSISGGITVLNDSFTLPNGEKLDDGSFYINKGSEKNTTFESYSSEKRVDFGNNDIYFFFGKRDMTKSIEKCAPIVIRMDEEDAGKFRDYIGINFDVESNIMTVINSIRKASLNNKSKVTISGKHLPQYDDWSFYPSQADQIILSRIQYVGLHLLKNNGGDITLSLPIKRENLKMKEVNWSNQSDPLSKNNPVEVNIGGLKFILEKKRIDDFINHLNGMNDGDVVIFVGGFDILNNHRNLSECISEKFLLDFIMVQSVIMVTTEGVGALTILLNGVTYTAGIGLQFGQAYLDDKKPFIDDLKDDLISEACQNRDDFSSTEVYTTDEKEYWGTIDDQFISRTGSVPMYVDGDNSILTSGTRAGFKKRLNLGKIAGKNMAIKLESMKFEKPKSELKLDIVSHSMGFAYSLGMIEVLQEEGYQIGWLYAIAPENPSAGYVPKNIEGIWQYGSDEQNDPFGEQDGIAPQAPIPGVLEGQRVPINCNETPCGQYPSHAVGNYGWVFEKDRTEEGYVKPRD